MKRILKISVCLGITALYCFILGSSSEGVVNSSIIHHSSGNGLFISDASSGNLYTGERSENLINVSGNVSHTNLKNSFNQFSAYLVAPVKLLNNRFLPYFANLNRVVSLYTTTDIIYPFHYFW